MKVKKQCKSENKCVKEIETLSYFASKLSL